MGTDAQRHEFVSVEKVGDHECWATCSCGRRKRGTTKAKARKLIEEHAARQNPPCPHRPNSAAYETREQAEQAMVRTWRIRRIERAPTGVYLCRDGCGLWHLTNRRRTF
ncbi:hypothetical protein [Nocardia sp. NPDC057030]|uniref:hypothetical protein n=1 Tax=unclassified Nocardia TaxID=2637762 RepID=UPI00362BDF3D